MSSTLRDESPGFHHVWCRGNNKRAIVMDDDDRRDLLSRIESVATEYGWQIYAYCVMDNHYHLVMEIGICGMSRGFCRVNTGYATAFNERHGRVNHLFGRRYGNKVLEDEAALLWACRYVVRNPVRAGLVSSPEQYRWSSYRATVGIGASDLSVTTEALLGSFHSDVARARELFAKFVGDIRDEKHTRRQPK